MKIKDSIYNILITSFVFLFLVAFPFDLFIKNNFYILLAQIIVRLVFIIFIFLFSKKYMRKIEFKLKKLDLFFLPLIVILFCNFYYLAITNNGFNIRYDNLFFIRLISIIFISISEELLFRNLILNNLSFKSKLVNIIISSLIFALYHLVYFFSSFNPFDLLIVLYTFGLGMILGFIYEYSNNFLYIILYHFLFNFINEFLYSYMIINENITYFIINGVVVSLFGFIYLLLIYLFVYKNRISENN